MKDREDLSTRGSLPWSLLVYERIETMSTSSYQFDVTVLSPPDRDRRVDSHAFSARVPDVPREPPDEAGLMSHGINWVT